MALQKDIDLDNGINLPDAYIKIYSINFSYSSPDSVLVGVAIYKDEAAYNNKYSEVMSTEHYCRDGVEFNTYFSESVLNQLNYNPVSQAYKWLKTLEIYLGAIDV